MCQTLRDILGMGLTHLRKVEFILGLDFCTLASPPRVPGPQNCDLRCRTTNTLRIASEGVIPLSVWQCLLWY